MPLVTPEEATDYGTTLATRVRACTHVRARVGSLFTLLRGSPLWRLPNPFDEIIEDFVRGSFCHVLLDNEGLRATFRLAFDHLPRNSLISLQHIKFDPFQSTQPPLPSYCLLTCFYLLSLLFFFSLLGPFGTQADHRGLNRLLDRNEGRRLGRNRRQGIGVGRPLGRLPSK
jgi:hypothetical protein